MGILQRLKKVPAKTKEVGLGNCLLGCCKTLQYRILQKKYGFHSWHLSPYEWRRYLQVAAAYINKREAAKVVDIGCGLGGLLQHIKAPERIGLDIHGEVIEAARALSDSSIRYQTGSFHELSGEKGIDYLITFGFTHGGTEETWVEPYHTVAANNEIRHFMVDTVPEEGTSHFLNYSKILPSDYKKIKTLGPYLGGRCIEVWEKRGLTGSGS